MNLHERIEFMRNMSKEEKEAYIRERANTQGNIRYRLALRKSIRESERIKKARKAKTKLIIAALSSFCITLSSILIISYLYLN